MTPHDEADKDTTDVAQDEGEGRTGPGGEAEARPTPEEQLTELEDKWLRARAELDNVRRRARLDVEDARRYGAGALLGELLEVVDTLQRALASAGEDADPQLVEGLQLTERKFLRALENHGVVPVPSAPGDAFDPGLHRAVVEQPSREAAPGTILAEVVRGYQLHDRLLREAQVVVAARPDETSSEPGEPPPPGDGDADV